MDINFHYFAVKAIALWAGFAEEDAQIIASFSQYVDDFSTGEHRVCIGVPAI